MQVFIKGKNFSVNDALHGYIEEKIGHLAHYFERIIDAHVTLRTERSEQIVDVTLNLPHYLIKAEERSQTMHAAVDLVRDSLEQQIRKYKTKKIGRHHRANDAPATDAAR
ncbi:MAG: ribosome-associated translation inhibitor RaiA [Candidatus Eremiobacteraeota bacterium]|nr:ribosome-associated translation inhibitor RaiA [Candidatus Eremiobacteraeota bacterium]MBC5827771.1 ribosome-associated translation inhibitor RaiA [Candidatus Eremiobacteraeota bacterium]